MSGISSRVVAKLTKSETVTTETILRICETLQCNISDVMECVDEDAISVYQAYLSSGKITDENELFKTVSFSKSGRNYTVYVSKKRATKATHIECRDNNTIYWVQFFALPNLVILLLQFIFGVVVYIGISRIFKEESFMYILQMIKENKHKIQRK